jgi:site-specific recombinase XerD
MKPVRATNLKLAPRRSELDLAVKSFLLDREAKRCTAATMVWYERYVGALADWLTQRKVTNLAAVSPSLLREYLVDLRERGLGDRTIHHHASASRAFFNFCAEEELIEVSPMLRVRMPRLPKEILPALSAADVLAILAACENDRDTAIILVLLDTGCRLAEFIGLRVGHVDLTADTVMIRQGKGKKDRITFIGPQAKRALRKYLTTRPNAQPGEALWLTEDNSRPLTLHGMQRLLQRIGDRAGVENCHAHTFRRTFAIESLRAGMDIYSLQRIMGHADLGILRKYLDQNEEDLQRAHAEHGAVTALLSAERKRGRR